MPETLFPNLNSTGYNGFLRTLELSYTAIRDVRYAQYPPRLVGGTFAYTKVLNFLTNLQQISHNL